MRKNGMQQAITALSLIAIGIAGRIFLRDFLPNTPHIYITLNGITQPVFMMDMFFVVAAISLFSGILLKGYYSFIVPLSIMLITDIYYGNTYIFLFTWSGFVFIVLIGYLTKKGLSFNTKSIIKIAGAGVGSILLYDAWTNFGCWLGWYPHTLNGLTTCFVLALPFMLWHLVSTTCLITALSIPFLYVKEKMPELHATIKPMETYVATSVSLSLAFLSIIAIFV
ncbi:MAG: hypothetical protein FE048_03760 [Thermoplasmata archaeon]|nr:MAG: hypothetical protein FE048_03760 [Thermoplasmata archaeon]